MLTLLASFVGSIAFADPCRGLGVGKDPGSSVSITTVVRSIAGPALPIRLELHGGEPRLVAGPQDAGAPAAAGVPAVFVFEGGTRATFLPATVEQVRSIPAGTFVFVLGDGQRDLLVLNPVTKVVLPLASGRELSVMPDKDNQKTLQDGARCVASRV